MQRKKYLKSINEFEYNDHMLPMLFIYKVIRHIEILKDNSTYYY